MALLSHFLFIRKSLRAGEKLWLTGVVGWNIIGLWWEIVDKSVNNYLFLWITFVPRNTGNKC